MASQLGPTLRAYIDETGDRGSGGSSSEFFGMAAVVVDDAAEAAMRNAVQVLRADLKVPNGKPMHWREHVKSYDRRQHVAKTLGGVPGVVTAFVLARKQELPAGAGMATDQVVFYNYVAGLMLERIAYIASEWPGGRRQVKPLFGHVRGFDHTSTKNYFARKRGMASRYPVPWSLVEPAKFVDAGAFDLSQAADAYAGMLNQALRPGEFHVLQPQHLLACWHQIRRSSTCVLNYGIKSVTGNGWLTGQDWWPCLNCPR